MKVKYYCFTKDCKVKETPGFTNAGGLILQQSEEEMNQPTPCPVCGETMKLMGHLPTGGFSKTSLMDKHQKKDMLLKRSHEHFKKHVKPYKEHLNQQVRVQTQETIKQAKS